ncbi:MAG: tetratricopeptide repeat protein [Bacteroidota bacterium]
MKCFIYVFLLFFGLSVTHGQLQKTIDSLEVQLQKTSKNSEEYVNLLNSLGYQFWVRDSRTSAKYGQEALEMSSNLNYTQGMAMAHRILGVSYWTFGEPKKALENLKQSQELYQSISDREGAANALMNSGMVYADIGEFDTALRIYEQSIEKFRQLDLNRRIATTFTKIGSVLIQQKKLDEAKNFLTNALNMHSEDGYDYGVSEAHNRLGILSLMQNELELGEYHIQKSMEIVVLLNDEDGKLSNRIELGKLYRLQNKYALADSSLLEALKTSKEKGLKKYQLKTYKELKLLKRQEGKLNESLEYYDKFILLKDSIINNEKAKQIAALEFNIELAEKETEIELLKETKKTRNIINLSLSVGLLLLSCIAILMLKHQRQREKREVELLKSNERLTQAELENAQLRQRELEQKLEFKNKELTSYTLNFAQKNELFGELLEKITSLQSATPSQQSKILNELRKKIRSHTNVDRDWEDFKRYFE